MVVLFNSRTTPFALAAFFGVAAILCGIAVGVDAVEQARLAARWTARVGFPIFLVTYSASSLYQLWPTALTRDLLRHRRQWGLGFALAHTVHLAALINFSVVAGQQGSALTALVGGLGYVLLYAMALTSNDGAMRRLGKNWKRLHSAGIHLLWVIFVFTYAGRLADPDSFWQGVLLLASAVAALGLRLFAWRNRRRLAT